MSDKLNKNGEYQRKFIANVSHDFRSPLTSIKGYVNAILDGTIPYEMQERYLKVIAFESTRLEKLTRSLLTLNELDVKKRMMHMRRFDINETIRTTAATFEGTCSERNIRLELLLAGKELFVRADMEQIQQVLYNLLDNAVKYTQAGGTINVSVAQWEMYVEIKVSDTGKGISESNQASIFKRFYREEEIHNQPGVGIGLYLTREIVTQQGGYVTVESQVGKGSAFSIFLPR